MIKKSLVFITSIFLLLGLINFVSANGANGSPSPALFCSDKIISINEQCDDGNLINGDGCSSTCQVEIPENSAPVCSVDSMENRDTRNKFFFEDSIYINENGNFLIQGSAFDEDSDVRNVQYTRSDDFDVFPGQDAIPFDGTFNSGEETWKSVPTDPGFNNGEYELCCRATDGVEGPTSCQEFCIDTLEPNKPSMPQAQIERNLETNCIPDSNYMNSKRDELSFTWSATESNGCSPIDYYKIELEIMHIEGNTGSTSGKILTSNTNSISISDEDLNDGDVVRIRVRAFDQAGNVGEWSEFSTPIIIDNTNPEVDITTDAGVWYTDDFSVKESDSDENDIICEYKIINPDGVITLNWTEIKCNTPITVDVSEDCPVDGLNDCKVFKRVRDIACNDAGTSKQFDLDRVAPVTTKTVGEPKYTGFLWMEVVVDWFITDKTQISFECADETSGCNNTWYKVTPDMNEFQLYDGEPFSVGEADGLYTVEYFSVDKAGNEEIHKFEVDKIDTMPPQTTKTIGQPQFFDDDERLWVSNLTEFMLTCADEEVGCMTSYVSFDNEKPFAINEDGKFTLQGLQDGEHTINYWSVDKLSNPETLQTETDWLDSTPPLLMVFHPNKLEAGNVTSCYQDIEALVGDSQSGVKKVWAELFNESKEKVKTVDMFLRNDGLYEALMDKQLPAGNYHLIVYAEDNVGNINSWHSSENLVAGTFVEYLSPATCSVNTELGGSCKFTYHVCMRGANSVEFWMDKMGIPGVPPGMLNATVSKGEGFANVGLLIDGESGVVSPLEPSRLQIGEQIINGKTTFDLNLHIPADTASQIGAGAHKLLYQIDSFDDVPILPICGNNIIENTEQCDDNNILDGDGCSSTCQIESLPQ